MKKIFLALASVAMLVGPLTSCDDELDIDQLGNKGSESDYYHTDADAQSAIALCYWQWTNLYNGIAWTADMLSDDIYCGGSDSGDDADYHQLNNYNIGTENGRVESDYSGLYTLIYYSNLVIEKVGANETLTPFMKQCIAEAYFFRGFAHFWLGVYWGNPPIVDHLLDPSEYHVSNSEDGAAYAQAASDIETAINSGALVSKSSATDTAKMPYITKEGAQAWLGKVYMFQGKYAEGAAVMETVINSGKYKLYDGEYADILKYVSNWSTEGVLECNAPDDPAYEIAWTFMTYNFISAGWRNDAFNWDGLYYFNDDDEWVKKPEWQDINTSGYGFCNPRKGIYDAFVKSDGADGYRTQSAIKTVDFVKGTMKLRLIKNLHGHDVYFDWKNRFLMSDMIYDNGGWNVVAKTTQRWMRYAEVLLNAAECQFKAGNTEKALKYVNEVRERAKATPYTSIDMDKIMLERRVELYREHNRWPDMIRWGIAYENLKDQGKVTLDLNTSWETEKSNSSNDSYGFVQGRNERLPYPNKEILLNPNIKQNPGY